MRTACRGKAGATARGACAAPTGSIGSLTAVSASGYQNGEGETMKRAIHRVGGMVLWMLIIGTALASAQQWLPQSSGSSGDLWSVDFVDERNGVAAVWIQPGAAEILRTSNGGSTWTKPFSDINQGCTGAYFLNGSRAFVVGGTNNFGRIFSGSSGGATWTLQMDEAAPRPAFWTIDFGDAQTGYAGGGNGIVAKTSNGGSSWSILSQTVPGAFNVLDLHFLDAANGYAVSSGSAANFFTGKTLYKTGNGGQSWTALQTFFALRAVHFTSDKVGFAVGNSGGGPAVWKTTDGGNSWTPKYNGSGGSALYLNDVCFTPENPFVGYAVGGSLWDNNQGIVISTTDGGESWVEEMSGRPYVLRSVDFPVETVGYACGSGGVILKTQREPRAVPLPTVELDTEELDFGDVETGQQENLAALVSPANVAGLRVEAVEFADPDAAAQMGFSLIATQELPAELPSGNSLQIIVNFAPTEAGNHSATVHVATNDEQTPQKELVIRGIGVEALQPAATISRTSIDFGTISSEGSSSATLEIRPANAAGLEVSSLALEGGDVTAFGVEADAALPSQLNEGEALELTLSFTPQAAGDFSSELVVVTNDAGQPEVRIPVSGSAAIPVSVNDDPGSLREPFDALLWPNPAGTTTRLRVQMHKPGTLQISAVDARGRKLQSMFHGQRGAGSHELVLDLSGLNSGTYFLRLENSGQALELPLVIRR